MKTLDFKKYLGIFKLPPKRHHRVTEQVKENSQPDLDYFVLTIFAGIIITLGLILNNSTVIIGGMLMAPLVWPILALAVAMNRGSLRMLENSIFTLVKSAALILIFAYLIGVISPFSEFGAEVISRTQPTIVELFIALASGFVAAFVIGYPGLGSFIAGVVIASAVVPPLCVTGLSLAAKNLDQAAGSLLLFSSNLIAMIIAAVIFFALANFKPLSSEVSQERRRSNLMWTTIFLIIIAIPLIIITSNALKNENVIKIVREIIISEVKDSNISDITLSDQENVYFIKAVIRAKSNLTPTQMNQLTSKLSQRLGRSVNLRITIIPILEGGQIFQSESLELPAATSTADLEKLREDVFPEIKENKK